MGTAARRRPAHTFAIDRADGGAGALELVQGGADDGLRQGVGEAGAGGDCARAHEGLPRVHLNPGVAIAVDNLDLCGAARRKHHGREQSDSSVHLFLLCPMIRSGGEAATRRRSLVPMASAVRPRIPPPCAHTAADRDAQQGGGGATSAQGVAARTGRSSVEAEQDHVSPPPHPLHRSTAVPTESVFNARLRA